MNPLVSVIIPCYNCSRFLEETLNSVLKQTFKPYEIIIINDGSTDNSYEIMKNYISNRVKVVNQENKGVSFARNRGIEEASGKYLYFLDADDLLHPDALQVLFDLVSASSYNSIGFMRVARFRNSIKNIVKIDDVLDELWPNIIHTNLAPLNAFLFPADLTRQIKGFDERISFGEDWDFLIRMAFAGAKLVTTHFVGAYYRLHEKSTCKIYNRPKRLLSYIILKENLCNEIIRHTSLLKKYGQEAFWSSYGILTEAKHFSISDNRLKNLRLALRRLAWRLILVRKATPFIFLYALLGSDIIGKRLTRSPS